MSKQRTFLMAVLLLAASATWPACDEKLSTLAGPTPNLAPTFATIQSEIFEKTDSAGRPACINCHTAAGPRSCRRPESHPRRGVRQPREHAVDRQGRGDPSDSRRSGQQLLGPEAGGPCRHRRPAHALQRRAVSDRRPDARSSARWIADGAPGNRRDAFFDWRRCDSTDWLDRGVWPERCCCSHPRPPAHRPTTRAR